MTEVKAARAVAAAAEVFLRYGYARTTMGDIAKAAGMSRPSLYLLFPGKESAFTAATAFMSRQRLVEIEEAVRALTGLEQKLACACDMLLTGVFELQQRAPDARDMDDLSFPAVRDVYQLFVDFFAGLLAQSGESLHAKPEEIARALIYGARGLRDLAGSEESYRAMIRLHVALLCGGAIQRGD